MKINGIASLVLSCSLLAAPARFARAAETDAEAEANRVAHDRVLCRKYGYEERSDEFAHCLDVLASRRAEAASKAATDRRKASSQQRALSSAENSACATRSEVVNGGSRANAQETGTGTCGH
jgi:hypothetical protein